MSAAFPYPALGSSDPETCPWGYWWHGSSPAVLVLFDSPVSSLTLLSFLLKFSPNQTLHYGACPLAFPIVVLLA